ncbi:hypothetical protein Bbelb_401900 [Branchiostoma belcheri]|nr:hypothetical protein Bbelb_401900 [Branchiostoma belcheri]
MKSPCHTKSAWRLKNNTKASYADKSPPPHAPGRESPVNVPCRATKGRTALRSQPAHSKFTIVPAYGQQPARCLETPTTGALTHSLTFIIARANICCPPQMQRECQPFRFRRLPTIRYRPVEDES